MVTTIKDSPKGSAIEQVTRLVEQGFEFLQDFYLNGIGHKKCFAWTLRIHPVLSEACFVTDPFKSTR